VSDSPFLIVGLGNIGEEYLRHRHNIGFHYIRELSNIMGFSFKSSSKLHCAISSTTINSHNVKIVQPTTFMNNSGICVQAVCSYFNIPINRVFVFYDDMDVCCGKVKIKLGGGSAGHNGIKSITQHLGADFYRVRIGIDRPSGNKSIVNHVLSNPSLAQQKLIDEAIGLLVDKTENIVFAPCKAQEFFHSM
jgi:PTH1 family peptidyl-tRNA hydrolase